MINTQQTFQIRGTKKNCSQVEGADKNRVYHSHLIVYLKIIGKITKMIAIMGGSTTKISGREEHVA
jgi:hypothetical protein